MTQQTQAQARLVQPLGPWREQPAVVRVKAAPAIKAKPVRAAWYQACHREVYERLDALAIGETAEFAAAAFRRKPGSLADYYLRRTGRKVRSMATSRGVMFVRIE